MRCKEKGGLLILGLGVKVRPVVKTSYLIYIDILLFGPKVCTTSKCIQMANRSPLHIKTSPLHMKCISHGLGREVPNTFIYNRLLLTM